MPNALYLHGFASGPGAAKSVNQARQLDQVGVRTHVPDLNEGDFEHLTIGRQLALIERLLDELRPDLVLGSSLGGYLAALAAARWPDRAPAVVLLAPAFGFGRRWAKRLGRSKLAEWRRTGRLDVYHYGERRAMPVAPALYEDALQYEPWPDVRQPALVVHGRFDEVVPADLSVRFAWGRPNVEVRLLDSDHALTDRLDTIWDEVSSWRLRLTAFPAAR